MDLDTPEEIRLALIEAGLTTGSHHLELRVEAPIDDVVRFIDDLFALWYPEEKDSWDD